MDLLTALIVVSEKAANIARLCRQNPHLFALLIQKKSTAEANPRFVDDFKTLADVLIQELVRYEIGNQFPELRDSIQGEENNSFSNKLGETIRVEVKRTAKETSSLLRRVLNEDEEAADLLAAEVHRQILLEEVNVEKKPDEDFDFRLEDVGVWIDPIDSTAEYINGSEDGEENEGISASGLKCVTVLIGAYDKKSGDPVIGVVNQPFVSRCDNRWTGVCFWGTPTATSLPPVSSSSNRTICVSSSEDQDVIARLKTRGYNVTEASGAGYKILTVLTGLADAYVLTKDSTFKWDTCGPQAILRGLGGDIAVYNEAIRRRVTTVKYRGGSEGKCNCGGIVAYRKLAVLNDIIDCLT